MKIDNRYIDMIARLFIVLIYDIENKMASRSTLRSSEAIFSTISYHQASLAKYSTSLPILLNRLLILDTQKAAGNACDMPNAVKHSNVHVCWKKGCALH